MDVGTRTTRAAAETAAEAARGVPTGRVAGALGAGADAVPGTQLATALHAAEEQLSAALRRLVRETDRWAQDVEAAMRAYEAADAEAADALRRLAGRGAERGAAVAS